MNEPKPYHPIVFGKEHLEALDVLIEKDIIQSNTLKHMLDIDDMTFKKIICDLKALGFVMDCVVNKTIAIDYNETISSMQEKYGLDYKTAASKFREAKEKWNTCNEVEIKQAVLKVRADGDDYFRLHDAIYAANYPTISTE